MKSAPTDDKGLPPSDESEEPRSHCDYCQCSRAVQHRMCRGRTHGYRDLCPTAINQKEHFKYHFPSLPQDYCASKFGAVGFHESLTHELLAENLDGIKTTLVCPYIVDTGMFAGCEIR